MRVDFMLALATGLLVLDGVRGLAEAAEYAARGQFWQAGFAAMAVPGFFFLAARVWTAARDARGVW